MGISVGDIVEVVEGGESAIAQVVKLGEDAWGEAVAYVRKLEHDGRALPLRQTASSEPVGEDRNGNPVFDKPVPFVRKAGSSVTAGSTLDTVGA